MYSRNFSGNIGTGLASVVLPPPQRRLWSNKKNTVSSLQWGGVLNDMVWSDHPLPDPNLKLS